MATYWDAKESINVTVKCEHGPDHEVEVKLGINLTPAEVSEVSVID